MINANELRVGNIVLINGHKTVVNSVSNTGINQVWEYEGDGYEYEFRCPYGNTLEGIPLTPELLERCGFVKDKYAYDAWEYKTENEYVSVIQDDKFFGFQDSEESDIGNPFQYLHQLQNICFCLFGIELEIKQPQTTDN